MYYKKLYSLNRSCLGHGINHENQKFTCSFEISPVVSGKGAELKFKALGMHGTVFHEEFSIIGPGFDGKPCLFVLSNNHPGVTPHNLKKTDATERLQQFIFAFGDKTNKKTFREKIALTIWNDGSTEYKYSWGLPDGEFAERSVAKMQPR